MKPLIADIDALPKDLPASEIGLPTRGVVVDSVRELSKGAPHWRVDARVLPLDSKADPIRIRVLIPRGEWNGRMLHIGGGGLDGFIPYMGHSGIGQEMWYGVPVPVARGYVVYGSDSGHQAPQPDATSAFYDGVADFSLNDEMLANYAHEAIKKTHDAVLAMVYAVYGRGADHSYYAGSSNGGRGALMAAQRYGDDYDGIISGCPALFWVGQFLYGLAVMRAEAEAGEEGFIDAGTWAAIDYEIVAAADALDGIEDGLVCNYRAARRGEAALRKRLAKMLTPAQMRLIERCTGEVDLSCLDNDEFPLYPGYSLCLGEPLRDDYSPIMTLNVLSSAPDAFDGFHTLSVSEIIAKQFLRQEEIDIWGFDPKEHALELRRASDLFDATDLEFTDFRANGGKAILYHGTYDQLVSVRGTIQYHSALRARHGAGLSDFLRLFVVPGLGHYVGRFDMGLDLLGALDAWVSRGEEPVGLVAQNRREDYGPREMLLCEWPSWPRYVGGDPDKASSYEISC